MSSPADSTVGCRGTLFPGPCPSRDRASVPRDIEDVEQRDDHDRGGYAHGESARRAHAAGDFGDVHHAIDRLGEVAAARVLADPPPHVVEPSAERPRGRLVAGEDEARHAEDEARPVGEQRSIDERHVRGPGGAEGDDLAGAREPAHVVAALEGEQGLETARDRGMGAHEGDLYPGDRSIIRLVAAPDPCRARRQAPPTNLHLETDAP